MARHRVRALQAAVVVAAIVPVAAGLAGVLMGPQMAGYTVAPVGLSSHFRYLSGLLLGIGLAFWWLVPRIATAGPAFRLLTAIVVIGGIGRAVGIASDGVPPAPMLFGLVMELVVTPLLCLWQFAVAAGARPSGVSTPLS